MAMSVVQSAESSVDTYISKISTEMANVDACARLVDAECIFLPICATRTTTLMSS